MPEAVTERYLTIQDRETLAVVTVIEILSPTNKRAGSDGRDQYLMRRDEVLVSATNLVELDLLRGGMRLPADQQLPPADFYAFVCRGRRRPRAEAYPWTLRQPLPTIPIPLAYGDPDVQLDLQDAFTTAYDRAGYDYGLDYMGIIEPPPSESDSEWIHEILRSRTTI